MIFVKSALFWGFVRTCFANVMCMLKYKTGFIDFGKEHYKTPRTS